MSYVHGTDPTEQRRLSMMNRIINEASLQRLDLAPGVRVLDIGSGLGQLTRAMARVAGRDGTVVGIERDDRQREQALQLAMADGETDLVDLRPGDASALSLSDGEWSSFDVVHCRFVLEHLADPLAAVRLMVAAARPGGRVVLQDDDHDLLRVWPPCEPFMRAWEAYTRSYTTMGNDPIVGRKLVTLLHEAGAAPTGSDWIFYGACAGESDFGLYIDNAEGVLAGARDLVVEQGHLDAAAYDDGLAAFADWRRLPDAAFWYCMCWAEGTTPSQTRAS